MSVELKASEIIEKFFDGFKKITPALVFCTIATGLILFLPISVLEKLGLNNISASWKTVIGLLFVVFTSAIVVIALSYPGKMIIRKLKRRKTLKRFEKQWINLNYECKSIVCTLLSTKEKSGFLSGTSGITTYLVSNEFIFRPDQIITPDYDNISKQTYIYCLHPWVIDLYVKKPKLFDMSMASKKLIKK